MLKIAKNKLKQIIFEEYSRIINENTLPGGDIIAYHCGKDIGNGSFSLNFIGSGEGYRRPPLGPGIYFATNENIARMYCKYANAAAQGSVFYEVSIPTSGLYNQSWGTPTNLMNAVEELFKHELETRNIRQRINMTDRILQLVDIMGAQAAAAALVKAGVNGAWTKLPAGGEEIAVFNPSIITIIRKEKIDDSDKEASESISDSIYDFLSVSLYDFSDIFDEGFETIEKGKIEEYTTKQYSKKLENGFELALKISVNPGSSILEIIVAYNKKQNLFKFDLSKESHLFIVEDIEKWIKEI